MATATVSSLVESLGQVVEGASKEELTLLERRTPQPRALAQELCRRGLVTAFQANLIGVGRAADLVVGQYILLERLGEGGMGVVYKARQRNLGRIVALKVIRTECLDNPKVIQRFQREIRAAGQLSHPHIVHAFDADQVNGAYYIAMEYIDGADLAQLVKQEGPLGVEQARDYMRQAALGLQHAHERGMVHRDIKPANLLVAKSTDKARQGSAVLRRPNDARVPEKQKRPMPYGVVKILDLGLARWQDPISGRASTHLTMMGVVMGTPDFISPEQARNSHQTDIRSDLYSLGCTFYFLLTGRIPFPNGAVTERLLQHQLDDPEPIVAVRRTSLTAYYMRNNERKVPLQQLDVPETVAQVVKKLMAKRPEERYQTPAEVVAALDSLEQARREQESKAEDATIEVAPTVPVAEPASDREVKAAATVPDAAAVTPPATRPRPRRRLLWIGAGAGAFVLLVLVLFRGNQRDPKAASKGATKTATAAPAAPTEAAWQALKKEVAACKLPDDRLRAKLVDFRRAHPAKAREVAVLMRNLPSPFDAIDRAKLEAKQVFAWMPEELVGVLGMMRPPWQGWRAPSNCVAVSADGRTIACPAEEPGIRLFEAGALPFPYRVEGPGRVTRCAFSPDGTLLATAGDDGAIRLYRAADRKLVHTLEKNEPRSLSPRSEAMRPISTIAFHPDGHTLASAGFDGVVRLWDVSSGSLRREIETNTSKILSLGFSPDGRFAVWGGINHEIHATDLEGKDAAGWIFTGHTAAVKVLAFHPDGQTVVSGGGDGALRVALWNGRQLTEKQTLKKDTRQVHEAAFSPDGQWLVTVGDDARIILWDGQTFAVKKEWELRWPMHGVAFAPDSRHFVVANCNSTLFVFRLSQPPSLAAR